MLNELLAPSLLARPPDELLFSLHAGIFEKRERRTSGITWNSKYGFSKLIGWNMNSCWNIFFFKIKLGWVSVDSLLLKKAQDFYQIRYAHDQPFTVSSLLIWPICLSHEKRKVKDKQLKAVENIVNRVDTSCILPTGHGMSLIFEVLPAVFKQLCKFSSFGGEDVVIVINSLRFDQVKDQVLSSVKKFNLCLEVSRFTAWKIQHSFWDTRVLGITKKSGGRYSAVSSSLFWQKSGLHCCWWYYISLCLVAAYLIHWESLSVWKKRKFHCILSAISLYLPSSSHIIPSRRIHAFPWFEVICIAMFLIFYFVAMCFLVLFVIAG